MTPTLLALLLAGCPSPDSSNPKDSHTADSEDTGAEPPDWVSVPDSATAPWAELHATATEADGTQHAFDCGPSDTADETLVLCGPMDGGGFRMSVICSPEAAGPLGYAAVDIFASEPLTTTDACADQAMVGSVFENVSGDMVLIDCRLADAVTDYEFVLSRAEFPDDTTMIAEGHFGGTFTYEGADYAIVGEFAARLSVSPDCQ